MIGIALSPNGIWRRLSRGNMGIGVAFLSSYGADFSATWASSQAAADTAWAAAQAAMNAGTIHTLLIDAGNVLAWSSSTFSVPAGCSVIGSGKSSIINTANNVRVFTCAGDKCYIGHLYIIGSFAGSITTNHNQMAVFNGNNFYECIIDSVWAKNMSGDAAFYFANNQSGTGDIRTSSLVNCVAIHGERQGFAFFAVAEYVSVVGCHATQNTQSNFYIAAGNTTLIGCTSTQSQTAGIELDSGLNDSHGSITGCRINHNVIGVLGHAITDGMLFSDCHFISNTTAQVSLTTSLGVRFSGCQFNTGVFNFDGSLSTYFDNDCIMDDQGGAFTINDNLNAHNSQTFWGDCHTLLNNSISPAHVRARRQIAGFPSDANHTLTLQEDTAPLIVVPGSLLTAARTLTSQLAPLAGMTPRRVVNNSGFNVTFGWSTGTGVTLATGTKGLIGSDGTNAILLGA